VTKSSISCSGWHRRMPRSLVYPGRAIRPEHARSVVTDPSLNSVSVLLNKGDGPGCRLSVVQVRPDDDPASRPHAMGGTSRSAIAAEG
jgi:hypothetical protein